MKERIRAEIRRFAQDDAGNRFPHSAARYFGEPLVGFAAADDPLFTEYKTVIGAFHLTPSELAAALADGEDWTPRTVICWVLPITEAIRASNRGESVYPSRAWAQTRMHGEVF